MAPLASTMLAATCATAAQVCAPAGSPSSQAAPSAVSGGTSADDSAARALPSRDDVHAYADLRQELEGLCGSVNGDYGELDWMPVRYIHRMVARKRVPGLCRAAAVGLVTPLRDGMNLVAKEYVVAQDPDNPGVLVLSRFAGAAEQLKEALLVNPYDPQGMADSIQHALQMPLAERQARHQKLMSRIKEHDVHWWRKAFLDALQTAG